MLVARISPDPLSPLVSIAYYPRQVFQVTSCVRTEILSIGSSWSSNLCSSMWRGPQEYIAYELCLTSPAVSVCFSSVGWGYRIWQLHLCKGIRHDLSSVWDMTLNDLMVRFQSWSFRECWIILYCYYSQVYFDPVLGSHLWVR